MNEIHGWDPAWESVFQQHEWGKYPPEFIIRFVARNFYAKPGRSEVRLLDLGCGPGACTWFMAREGFSVSGIDGSPTAIDRAGKRLQSEGLTADLRVGDFTILPWGADSFDAVIDCASLCHNSWQAARKAVSEVCRVLKPSGLLISSAFTDRAWGIGTGPALEMGGFHHVTEGPLAGKGYSRFLAQTQIRELYAPLMVINVEIASYTMQEMARLVELWLITCQKKAP